MSYAASSTSPFVNRRSDRRADVVMAVALVWRNLRKALIDPYRPELHYMRGPGPKWREKHAGSAGAR
jgi:hypothetical protein